MVLLLHACVGHESWQNEPLVLQSSGRPAQESLAMCSRGRKISLCKKCNVSLGS